MNNTNYQQSFNRLAKKLTALAQSTHRSKSFITAQAVEDFLNVQEWHMEAIKEGIAAAERGDVEGHSQDNAILNAWGKNASN